MKLGKIEAPVRLALAFFQACNRQAVEDLTALLSEDCRFESPISPCGEVLRGRESIGSYWREFFMAHPGARFEVQEAFGMGFHSVVRWICLWQDPNSGTHTLCGMDLFRIAGEVICEQVSFGKSGKATETV